MHDKIQCMVGDELRVIPMDIFQSVFDELAERYRAEGLRGEDLDIAICDALPERLAEVLNATIALLTNPTDHQYQRKFFRTVTPFTQL